MARIFISSTTRDLAQHRGKVMDVLRQMGHQPVASESFPASSVAPVETCLQKVRECDLFIGIIAWRYGYVPEGPENPEWLSLSQLEYREAKLKGIPLLMFLLNPDTDWPSEYRDDVAGVGVEGKRIEAFRRDIMRDLTVSFFRTSHELATLVTIAVANHFSQFGKESTERRVADQAKISQLRDNIALHEALGKLTNYIRILHEQLRIHGDVKQTFAIFFPQLEEEIATIAARASESAELRETARIDELLELCDRIRQAVGEGGGAKIDAAAQRLGALCWRIDYRLDTKISDLANELAINPVEVARFRPTPVEEPNSPRKADPLVSAALAAFLEDAARLAEFLARIALRDRAQLELCVAPTPEGLRAALGAANVAQEAGQFLAFAEQLASEQHFRPNALWLAWMQTCRQAPLERIRAELASWQEAPTPEPEPEMA